MRGVPADKSAAMMAPKQKVEKPMRIMGRLFGYILRRYKLHCLGVLLFIPQALRFLLPSSGTISIVINAVSFVVPAYYLLSAYLNYRDD